MISWPAYLTVGLVGLALSGWVLWESWKDYRVARRDGPCVAHAAKFLAVNAVLIVVALALNIFLVETDHHNWRHMTVALVLIAMAVNGVVFRRCC